MTDREDPILAELDQIRLEMYRELNGDIHALFEHLRDREASAVDLPKAPVDPA